MTINLKTTVSVPTEVSIELETPAFFKENTYSINEYLGVIDETTIHIFSYPNERVMLECEATERCARQIKTALDKWEHISEEEFFEALDKALKDFNFKPSLRHITASNGSEVTV